MISDRLRGALIRRCCQRDLTAARALLVQPIDETLIIRQRRYVRRKQRRQFGFGVSTPAREPEQQQRWRC
jgi:hypothetical protein